MLYPFPSCTGSLPYNFHATKVRSEKWKLLAHQSLFPCQQQHKHFNSLTTIRTVTAWTCFIAFVSSVLLWGLGFECSYNCMVHDVIQVLLILSLSQNQKHPGNLCTQQFTLMLPLVVKPAFPVEVIPCCTTGRGWLWLCFWFRILLNNVILCILHVLETFMNSILDEKYHKHFSNKWKFIVVLVYCEVLRPLPFLCWFTPLQLPLQLTRKIGQKNENF